MSEPPFDVRDPFSGADLPEVIDYGAVPSSTEAAAKAPSAARSVQQGVSGFYRLACAAMEVPGFGSQKLAGVTVTQVAGPMRAHSTFLKQMPGWHKVKYEKVQHQGWIEVGHGMVLTIATVPVLLGDEHLSHRMTLCRDEARAVLGTLCAVLDERLAQTELMEDLVLDLTGDGQFNALVDEVRAVRSYLPSREFGSSGMESLARLGDLDSKSKLAARWYLKGAQSGPTPDGVAFMCIAIDALVEQRKKKRSFDRISIEDAIREAGHDPALVQPGIGRLVALRGQVMHEGNEEPPNLRDGFYALEWVARLLLRRRTGVSAEAGWPVRVNEPRTGNRLTDALAVKGLIDPPKISITRHTC